MGSPKLTRATAIASWNLMAYVDDMVMSPLHHPRACAWNPPPLLEGLHFETKWRQGWEGWWTQFTVLTIVCPPARTRKLSAEKGWEPNANSAHPMLLLPPTLNPPTHFPTPLVNSDQSCEVTTQEEDMQNCIRNSVLKGSTIIGLDPCPSLYKAMQGCHKPPNEALLPKWVPNPQHCCTSFVPAWHPE